MIGKIWWIFDKVLHMSCKVLMQNMHYFKKVTVWVGYLNWICNVMLSDRTNANTIRSSQPRYTTTKSAENKRCKNKIRTQYAAKSTTCPGKWYTAVHYYKIITHSICAFLSSVKQNFLNMYRIGCSIPNCYMLSTKRIYVLYKSENANVWCD